MFELHEFYEELATKYNLSYDQIEKIARSEFKWLMESIQSNEFKIIKLKKFGKFVPNKVGIGFYDIYHANQSECSNRNEDQGEGESKEQDNIDQKNV